MELGLGTASFRKAERTNHHQKGASLTTRLAMALVSLALLQTILIPRTGSATPPTTGDWIVTANESYANTSLTVNGSLYVAAGATLVLDNVTLFINSTFDGGQRVQVNASGTLVLRNAVVQAYDPRFTYRLLVYGTLNVTNTTLRHLWGVYADPFPGGVQVLGGSLVARGLRLEFLRTNGIHVVRGNVSADHVWIDNAYYYGVYLNQTVGASFSNLTLFSRPYYGLMGLFSIDSTWGNITDLVSLQHDAGEVFLRRSDRFTIARAQLGGTGIPGSTLIGLMDSRDFSLYESYLNETGNLALFAGNSTASLTDVILNRTYGLGAGFPSGGPWASHSTVVMENIRFEGQLSPGDSASIGSFNTTWIGRNVTSEGAFLQISLLDRSYGYFKDISLASFGLNDSALELVNARQSSYTRFGVFHGSRALLVNYSFSTLRDGEWPGACVDCGSIFDPNNPSLAVQQNWLDVRTVSPGGIPIPDVDVLVTDNGTAVYASTGFGGVDPATGADGRTKTFTAPYRSFHHDNFEAGPSRPFTNFTYNAMAIQLAKPGYGFLPARDLLLAQGFEGGDRDAWARYTFNRYNAIAGEGHAFVVPGSLNGTGSRVIQLFAERDFQTDLQYRPLQSVYWRDYTVEVDARLVAGYPASSLKLFFLMRTQDGLTDGYRVDLSAANDTVRLYRHDRATLRYDGNPPTLLGAAPYAIDFGSTYHVRVDTEGGRIRILVNGSLLIDVDDATYTSGTVGIGADTGGPGMTGPSVTAWFDNILVYGHDGHTFVGDSNPPVIASATVSPDPVDVGSTGTIQTVVTDDLGVAGVWASVTGPSGSANLTMVESQPGLWKAPAPSATASAYAFTVWAQDVAGLWSCRAGTFSVADLSPPSFAKVSVTPAAAPPGPFAFSATVADNVGVAGGWANVTGPSTANLTLSPVGPEWEAIAPFAALGTYAVTFWAADAAGHWAPARASFTVGDFTPPVTTLAIAGANYTAGPVRYLAPSALVSLSATDDLSGVAETRYRLDGGAWTPYGGTFSLAAGPHLIEFRSVDNAGNAEPTQSALLFVDDTPPSAAVQVDGPSAGAVLGLNAALNLTATDGESAVAVLEWRWDGGPWSPYAGPIPAGPEGAHVLDYRATDRVGNLAWGMFAYDVDATPPTLTVRVFGPSVGNVLGPNASVVLFAADGGSGVASLEMRLDAGAWSPYAGPLAPGLEGNHVFDYRATDAVGNLAAGSFAYRVDATGPSISVVVGAPNVTAPASFVSPATPFSLSAVDPAGVATMSYRMDGGSWIAYDAPFLVLGEGPHTIDYKAVDVLGNPSAVASFATTVDGAPPDIGLLVGAPNATVGGVVYVDGATSFDVRASDTGVGLVSVACIVGGVGRPCSPPFDLSGQMGSVVVEVHAIDRLGNIAVLRKTFFVDPPPVAVIDALSGLSFTPGQPASFSGARSNDSAGVAAYEWDLGDGSRGSGVVANHSFVAAGEYVVTLTVTNVLGRTSTTSVRVTVAPATIPSEVIPGWVIPGFVAMAAAVLFLGAMWWRGKSRGDSTTSGEDGEEKQKDEEGG